MGSNKSLFISGFDKLKAPGYLKTQQQKAHAFHQEIEAQERKLCLYSLQQKFWPEVNHTRTPQRLDHTKLLSLYTRLPTIDFRP